MPFLAFHAILPAQPIFYNQFFYNRSSKKYIFEVLAIRGSKATAPCIEHIFIIPNEYENWK